jgi:hypothetical protein
MPDPKPDDVHLHEETTDPLVADYDPSQAMGRGRSLGRSGQFRSVCGSARGVADHAVLERTV